ncbi:dTDP-4-dehydrorhamnose reductase [Vibrio porteresiae]|uniref:dTDP-4-dehydrorhamnose reductase n=1 Tax=Vibrio porteresiae DSM 19223 TaxID=1123496 RepID=A0ABZ0QD35_9VIBR|nr:dTDP-4-dehydrorhamnose reductase [Vibrio porteresiae]WPC74305.1 dTDP-4-dehydrorhamnose reductase [Vibrio porteresiae DSM 19223]
MKIMITGSHGQVGTCLVNQLATTGHDVLAMDRDTLDITDAQQVMHTVCDFRPDVIINAAAHTAVDKAESERELSFAINRDGPKNLAEAAQEVHAAMLHISTDYVFAGNKDGIYIESDNTDPQGVYGASKLDGELSVISACDKHIILRTAWVFGEHGNNFVKTMLRLGQTRDTLGVVGDQFGGPTYAGDIAAALITIASAIVEQGNTEFGVYHFAGLPHVSWAQFAQTIFDKAQEQSVLSKKPVVNSITTADYPTPAKRPANSRLDTQKITQTFGIAASDWQAALCHLDDYIA